MTSNNEKITHGPFRHAIYKVSLSLLFLLILLLGNVTYIQLFQQDFLNNHPLNRRNDQYSHKIKPGDITDRHGEQLAYSHYNKSTSIYEREYPYGAITSHIIGYDSHKYGKSGLEALFNSQLSGRTFSQNHLGPISQIFSADAGNTVRLTIDANLQSIAHNLLGSRRGAIVVLDPRTGQILALVSKPAYNPNQLEQNWDSISQDSSSPLLNRATYGLYPPGSTLKIMMTEASLNEKTATLKQNFFCEGSLQIGPDYTLPEPGRKAHGTITLQEALTVSCNVTFAHLALDLGRKRIKNTFHRYGFDRSVEGDVQEITNQLPNFDSINDGEIAQIGIGQGKILVTPLHMAMLVSVFANQGTIMKPYLVDSISAPDGSVLIKNSPSVWITPTTPQLANTVAEMMVDVVSKGTGQGARIPGITVAGKTGTAENSQGVDHAWFVGFAPAADPQIAIAIIVENAGAGGDVAAPIAKNILWEALR